MTTSENMVTMLVDGKVLSVPSTYTLMQACELAGAVIPRFCYHERLSIAGNCRMCLVEAVGTTKPLASCAYAVGDLRPPPAGGMPEVKTDSEMVIQAREGVLGFILANHPLDCPICDQGGECDLQDQAMAFGRDRSHFVENKRAVEDKYIGPLVKTSMNRCIHCTRCVRFISEVAGAGDLGATGRGEDMEITTYLETAMTSELQGNVIDLCPVGALTSRPYAFTARPWELRVTQSIDVHDATGSEIQIDSRSNEVMRIRPGINPAINEEWLPDRSRFIWDGLKTARLDRPWLRSGRALRRASWGGVLDAVSAALRPRKGREPRVLVLAGGHAGVEEMVAVRDLLGEGKNVRYESRLDGNGLHPKVAGRAGYTLGCSISGIERADGIMLVGCNPRLEAPIINARIRKAWLHNGAEVSYLGAHSDTVQLTYPAADLGSDISRLRAIEEEHSATKARFKNPLVMVGSGALQGGNASAVLAQVARIVSAMGGLRENWCGFGVLPYAAAAVGALDIGFVPQERAITLGDSLREVEAGEFDVIWLLGADLAELRLPPRGRSGDGGVARPFVVYQGSHGDIGAQQADAILPAAAYCEKVATYVSAEARVQRTRRAVFPPGEAREDWAIVRALSAVMRKALPYNSREALQQRVAGSWSHLADIGNLPDAASMAQGRDSLQKLASARSKLARGTAVSTISDPYQINPIMRASAVMRDVSARRVGDSSEVAALEPDLNQVLARRELAKKMDTADGSVMSQRSTALGQRMGV